MKYRILTVLIVVSSWWSYGQDLSDVNRLVLSTYVPNQKINLSEQVKGLLEGKLNQIVTQNGVGGSDHNGRFVLMANITESTKDIIPGPPQMVAITLQMELTVIDAIEQKRFSSVFIELKGVGEGSNENKAMMEAVKKINPKKQDVVDCIEMAKNKIINYYRTQCDFIIREAMAQSTQENYDEAMRILSEIPEVCEDCYVKSLEFVDNVYQKKVDKECKLVLKKAESAWISNMNPQGAKDCAQLLNTLSPFSSCNEEAEKLMVEIERKLEKEAKDRFQFELKKYNDAVSLKKEALRIDEENNKRLAQLKEDKQKQDYQLQRDQQKQNYDIAKKEQSQDGFKGVINSIVKLKTQLWSSDAGSYKQQNQVNYSSINLN